MNKRLKQVLVTGLVLVGIGVVSRRVEAAQPDTMTLSVTPSGQTYSVVITSVPNVGYNFGTVTIGGTTVSTAAITVANSGGGNSAEYFGMKVSNTNDGWQPTGPGVDTFRLIGEFGTNQPDEATGFIVGDAITGSFPGAAATLYGQSSTKTSVGNNQKLWLRLEMPTSVNTWSGGAETMTLFIQGQSS